MSDQRKITIEVHRPPVVYRVEADFSTAGKSIQELAKFTKRHNDKILQLSTILSTLDLKTDRIRLSTKDLKCRLPNWSHKAKMDVPEAIALILYFTQKPLTTGKATQIINSELKKVHLRNVSKYLTSRGSGLYGYTTYDASTKRYSLNDYGKRWVESKLIPKFENIKQLPTKGKSKKTL